MKLNYDCVRDVLLALEENLTIEALTFDLGDSLETTFSFSPIGIDKLSGLDILQKYDKKDIFYSINKLEEAGYINANSIFGDDVLGYLISDITYAGHEFLQSIKSDTVWSNIKDVSKKAGAMSFPIISSIASSILEKIISKAMGMP